MTDQPYITEPRRPAEEWLHLASDLHHAGLSAQGTRGVAMLGIAEALVRIADHLEELIAELREQRR